MKTIVTLAMLTLSLWSTGSALAGGYPWREHAPPFDFTFGNHFDMHQQSRELGNGQLQGFQYIELTGATTPQGYPIAVHGQATVGWIMHGIPGVARLAGFDSVGQPLWLVDPTDLPRQVGYRPLPLGRWAACPRGRRQHLRRVLPEAHGHRHVLLHARRRPRHPGHR